MSGASKVRNEVCIIVQKVLCIVCRTCPTRGRLETVDVDVRGQAVKRL
jgi:hypothetical protein